VFRTGNDRQTGQRQPLAATRCGTHALDVFGEHFAVGPARAAVCVALARVADAAAVEDRIRDSGGERERVGFRAEGWLLLDLARDAPR
jgi:hypothetical protein